jgi:hypothetical protein
MTLRKAAPPSHRADAEAMHAQIVADHLARRLLVIDDDDVLNWLMSPARSS